MPVVDLLVFLTFELMMLLTLVLDAPLIDCLFSEDRFSMASLSGLYN